MIYISKYYKAKYYYYGEKDESIHEMKATISFVDYVRQELAYDEKENMDSWGELKTEDLRNTDLIMDSVKDEIINKGIYKAYYTKEGESLTIARGASTGMIYMTASRLLSNRDKTVYDNNVEILKIDGKTARTIQESNNGEQIVKSYTPGNYEPSLKAGISEQDDDRVKIIITPPTGLIDNIMTYRVMTLGFLIIAFIGILIIKKKVFENKK